MQGGRGRRGEADQKTVQWTVFPPNARARLRGPGDQAKALSPHRAAPDRRVCAATLVLGN